MNEALLAASFELLIPHVRRSSSDDDVADNVRMFSSFETLSLLRNVEKRAGPPTVSASIRASVQRVPTRIPKPKLALAASLIRAWLSIVFVYSHGETNGQWLVDICTP